MYDAFFRWGSYRSASGQQLRFKLECDELLPDDWECITELINERVQFKRVFGVPTGGFKIQRVLRKFEQPKKDLRILIIDDIYTTGGSIATYREWLSKHIGVHNMDNYVGGVLFKRNEIAPEHSWVKALGSFCCDDEKW